MELIAIVVMVFLGLRILVALVNLVSRPWLPFGEVPSAEKRALRGEDPLKQVSLVSVLIPARNEAQNIGRVLQDLLEHDYRNLEILVYDDLSEDLTAEVVRRFEVKDRRVTLLSGKPLPPGWLGKNHACDRLAKEARGDYLLFLDADVRVLPGLIGTSLSHVKKHELALLSIFPRQIMKTFAEKISVPLMNWILVSLLPLLLTRVSSWPSFSAANGQFMLFDAQVYRQHWFHEMVKRHQVEDIIIFRQMKRIGLRVQTLLSNGSIACRMYRSFGEAAQGFSKNLFAFFGGSIVAGVLFGMVTTFGLIPVWTAWGGLGLAGYLLAAAALRGLVAIASRQPVWLHVLLAPLQQMAFVVVIYIAIVNQLSGKTRWKGRDVKLA